MRRAVRVEHLSDTEIAMIVAAEIAPEDTYEVEDLKGNKFRRTRNPKSEDTSE